MRALVALAAVALAALGCRSAPPPPTAPPASLELRNAVLWMARGPEYAGATIQAFRIATARLDEALADPSWTAALEQTGAFSGLPPAVVVDVDDTVLDTTAFQRALVDGALPFSRERWNAWAVRGDAPAVPGARAFLDAAAARGVEVFYVTNRTHALEAATRENLRALGLPVDQEIDTVLTLEERPAWTRDKGSRRAEVARGYRVLLIVGDQVGDFVSSDAGVAELRAEAEGALEPRWGTRWIVVPNPVHGVWAD